MLKEKDRSWNVNVEPSLREAAEIIKENLRKRVILVVGKCWVNYRGRASSKLGLGERMVIIKEDGALLVHRPKGYEPVNWMPGGKLSFYIKLISEEQLTVKQRSKNSPSTGVLLIKAVRRKPAETVNIFISSVYLLSVLKIADEAEFSLYASEEDMQKAILLEPSLVEDGFRPVAYEKKVEPGFLDVYGVDKNGRFVVVEIKRKTAGKEAALQLAKYVESVREAVNREVRGILVAPSIAKGVQRVLTTLGLDFKALNPKRCAEILARMETKKLEDFL